MNLDPSTPDEQAISPELDALILAVDEELTLLNTLHFRLAVLRLVLVNGNPYFIRSAASDVAAATQGILEHEAVTASCLADVRALLGLTTERLAVVASHAPETHRRVLVRLSGELEWTSRSIEALRDAVRRQCEDGRRTVLDVLDLTESQPSDQNTEAPTGQLFRGQL